MRALDNLLHGQAAQADELRAKGVEVMEGDVRDPEARAQALVEVDEIVHLAAIVGDPACARDAEQAHEVNVEGSRGLIRDARAGATCLVFASTCANFGRMADPDELMTEDSALAGENYRKHDLIEELRRQTDRGEVSFVVRSEDVRNYKVSFDRVVAELGFETLRRVPDGIAEILDGLEAGVFGDPFARAHRNTD